MRVHVTGPTDSDFEQCLVLLDEKHANCRRNRHRGQLTSLACAAACPTMPRLVDRVLNESALGNCQVRQVGETGELTRACTSISCTQCCQNNQQLSTAYTFCSNLGICMLDFRDRSRMISAIVRYRYRCNCSCSSTEYTAAQPSVCDFAPCACDASATKIRQSGSFRK